LDFSLRQSASQIESGKLVSLPVYRTGAPDASTKSGEKQALADLLLPLTSGFGNLRGQFTACLLSSHTKTIKAYKDLSILG